MPPEERTLFALMNLFSKIEDKIFSATKPIWDLGLRIEYKRNDQSKIRIPNLKSSLQPADARRF
jgi:hypothetical protein